MVISDHQLFLEGQIQGDSLAFPDRWYSRLYSIQAQT